MVPGECRIEADIRLPVGLDKATLMSVVEKIVSGYPEVTLKELNHNAPSWCDPDGEMMRIIRGNVRPYPASTRIHRQPGATDARLWRYRKMPAYIYGPPPNGMGSHDDRRVDDFFHVLRTHV